MNSCQALEADPCNASALSGRAAAHNKLRNYMDAVSDATAALETDPDLVSALTAKGCVMQGDHGILCVCLSAWWGVEDAGKRDMACDAVLWSWDGNASASARAVAKGWVVWENGGREGEERERGGRRKAQQGVVPGVGCVASQAWASLLTLPTSDMRASIWKSTRLHGRHFGGQRSWSLQSVSITSGQRCALSAWEVRARRSAGPGLGWGLFRMGAVIHAAAGVQKVSGRLLGGGAWRRLPVRGVGWGRLPEFHVVALACHLLRSRPV